MTATKDPRRIAGGRKAARTAKKRYGGEFHREIGARGGRSTASSHDRGHFERIGRKGGES